MGKKEDLAENLRDLVAEINGLPDKERTQFIFDTVEGELRNLRVGENDSVDALVFVTRDLTQFKDIPGNRIINAESRYIEKLADNIALHGLIQPVIVNEKFGMVDGQRRVAAIRRYGLPNPVAYIRKEGAKIDIIGEINSQNLKWNYRDWQNRWEEADKEAYKEYRKIGEKFEHYMKSRSLRGLLMLNRVDALPSEVWERGQFTIDKENLQSNIQYLLFLERVYTVGGKDNVFAADRGFQKALHELWKKTKNLDTDRLLVKMRTHFYRLNVRVDYKTYKKIIGEVYNSRLAPDKHHMVTEETDKGKEKKKTKEKQGQLNLN